MRTVTVSHNWYSFLRCSGVAVPTVFGVLSDVSCRDWGTTCRAWSGLVGMKAELGHSLTQSYLLDLKMLPQNNCRKWKTSIVLTDEDFKMEIQAYLNGLGPYISAKDVVDFSNTPEIWGCLGHEKPISLQTVKNWLMVMGYDW